MDDCGGLENRYTSGYRGFESHSLRQRFSIENGQGQLNPAHTYCNTGLATPVGGYAELSDSAVTAPSTLTSPARAASRVGAYFSSQPRRRSMVSISSVV